MYEQIDIGRTGGADIGRDDIGITKVARRKVGRTQIQT
jgi:hypothetical protein